ncbi:MAG: hypothetical protein M1828_001859 [Chrysothrix sp. TS-e1954]|nr:MAG: hypothetical protein M1828_001859 [Chrysothrix sp. TS-e1954]
MKFSFASTLVLALAAENVVASSWFSKAVYNTWHENELERWLSDHNVPYPTPADRKDLQNLVKSNWKSAVESPYVNWDATRLQKQIQSQGAQVKKGTEKNKNALQDQVKSTWQDTEGSASTAYGDVRNWIFDSWTDSALKSFCDKHSIPVPQPRRRDQYLKAARENYQSVANKLGETAAYPGNWLYETWSDSDAKSWLDERGIPVPQPGNRDKLIASIRRNARVASLNSQSVANRAQSSVSSSAKSAKETLSDSLLDSWSDSQIKEWADKNGIKVPQGSNRNELVALARKHSAKLTGDNVSDEAASAMGAATSSAGNQYSKATDSASTQGNGLADQAYSYFWHYASEAQVAVGLKTDLASSASRSAYSASKSASSAYAKVTGNQEL